MWLLARTQGPALDLMLLIALPISSRRCMIAFGAAGQAQQQILRLSLILCIITCRCLSNWNKKLMIRAQYGEPPSTRIAAAMFQRLCYENKDALSAGIIVGGWDESNGGKVFSIPLGGSLHQQPFAIGGALLG